MYNTISDKLRRYKSDNEKSLRHMFVPLQFIGMALTLRKHGRHSVLVDLLHAWGIIEDNKKCILAETYLASFVLQNMKDKNGLFIPTNLTIGKPIYFYIDNLDFQEDTGIQTRLASRWFPGN